jgi:hypothetical protein
VVNEPTAAPKSLITEVGSQENQSKDWLSKKDSNYAQFNLSQPAKVEPATFVKPKS